MPTLKVVLEATPRRTFAIALDWPGWSRAGRTEEEALAALADYAGRYRRVLATTSHAPPDGAARLEVVDRLRGGPGTDFGVPSAVLPGDDEPLSAAQLERQVAILDAAWASFDRAAHQAAGHELRKGPRGGGRDLPKIVGHVLEAEEAYLTKLGSRRPRDAGTTVEDRTAAVRATALAALDARAHGRPVADPAATEKLWSPRYFVRRSAWHALDHAWEIEDRII